MPLLMEQNDFAPPIGAEASLAVEIDWAIASVERLDWRRDHAGLAQVYSELPELVGRVRSFWPPELAISCGGAMELMVLAHRGGLLFSTDPDQLLGQLDRLCRIAVPLPELASESPEDRLAIHGRLSLLARSTRKRRQYIQLLSDVWAAVGPLWEREGRGLVERAVRERLRAIDEGRSWPEVVGRGQRVHTEELDALVRGLGRADRLVVVPAYFTHLGLICALSGVVVVGVRAAPADPKLGIEPLARRLKAAADPTRLAILGLLARGPSTVSELARQFGVAQPTISNHVKLLRDAGLVGAKTLAGRRELTVDEDSARRLLEELGTTLTGAAPV